MLNSITHMHNVTECATCNKVIKETDTMKINLITGKVKHKGCK